MRTRSVVLVAVSAAVVAATTWALVARPALGQGVLRWLPATTAATADSWPASNAKVIELAADFPNDFMKARVFVDAGHGASGNTGNRSSFCEDEQDFTLPLAQDLARALEDTGRFEARVSRTGSDTVPYPDRVTAAAKWGAHAFVSLHSDVRGTAEAWSPEPGKTCSRSVEAPGFSVLWSDDGTASRSAERRSLARATATSLLRARFPAYGGQEYHDNYKADDGHPGVFLDRHPPGKRIYVLHKPTMPSIIIETHNAWDPREAERWREPATRRAFFSAVVVALAQALPSTR